MTKSLFYMSLHERVAIDLYDNLIEGETFYQVKFKPHHHIYCFNKQILDLVPFLQHLSTQYIGLIFRKNYLESISDKELTNALSSIPAGIYSLRFEDTPKRLRQYLPQFPEQITELDFWFFANDEENYDEIMQEIKDLLKELPLHVRKLKFGFVFKEEWKARLQKDLSTIFSFIPAHITDLSIDELYSFSHKEEVLAAISPHIKFVEVGAQYFENCQDSLQITNRLQLLPTTVSRLNLSCLVRGIKDGLGLTDKMVGSALSHTPPHITSLFIPGQLFSYQENTSIANIFDQLPQTIIELDLSNPYHELSFSYPNSKLWLLAFFKVLPDHITKLTLSNFGLGLNYQQIDWDEFFKAIPSTVIELDLSMNRLDNLEQEVLKQRFKLLPANLKKINLSYNGFESKTKEEWIELLIALPNSIEEIVVEDRASRAILTHILPQVRQVKLEAAHGIKTFPAEEVSALGDLIIAYDEDNVFYKKPKPKPEAAIETIIQEHLLPLTQDYLEHLSSKLTIDFNLTSPLYEEQLKDREGVSEETRKIVDKCRIVRPMYDALNDKTLFPSERLSEFTQILANEHYQEQLAQHRNPQWQQYLKNVLVIFAITLSGVIPGLLALFAYSHFKNKTSPTFFTKVVGEEYLDKVQEIMPQCPVC